VRLFIGVTRASDRLYNRGLAKLRAGDLTAGKDLLTRAIAVNRNNAAARNLLGLVMFETGHAGEALTQWVLSSKTQEADNPAVRYIEETRKNTARLEKMDDAIGMYNQALGHIRQKSDDLAIIELKKAVDLSPKFVDALNLLALCYMIQGERERAIAPVQRVLEVDRANLIALGYLGILQPSKGRSLRQMIQRTPVPENTTPRPVSQNTGPYKPVQMVEEKKPKSFHLAEILTFIIGVIVAAAVMYFIIMPGIDQRHDTDMAEQREEMLNELSAVEARLQQAEGHIEDRDETVAARDDEIAGLHADLYMQLRINDIHTAHQWYLAGELQEAINILDTVDRTGLRFDVELIARHIIENAYPELGAAHFAVGQAAFVDNDFALARGHLISARRFLTPQDYTAPLPPAWNELTFMLGAMHFEFNELDYAEEFLLEFMALVPQPPAARAALLEEMLEQIEATR
jgi:tetratricopeptide (TPR) repeat protein